MKSLRVLIVDDEPPARRKLATMLQRENDITLVGEAANGDEAVAAIAAQQPDVVFLDIQMPGLTGFEVIQEIDGIENVPQIVFVTAYEQHAVRAFEVDAVDYLLKPFDQQRLQTCLARVRKKAKELAARIMVKSRGRIIFVNVDEIDWIEAAGNYVELHCGKQTFLLRQTLAALEERLDAKRFARVHRTTIVNVGLIVEIEPVSHNDFSILLRDGARLRMSRRYRDNLPI